MIATSGTDVPAGLRIRVKIETKCGSNGAYYKASFHIALNECCAAASSRSALDMIDKINRLYDDSIVMLPDDELSRQRIAAVRRFSRFYTRTIGALGEGLLDSPFSLA